MVDKMVATLNSPSDIPLNTAVLKSFGDGLNFGHIRRLIACPYVVPNTKLVISMVHESLRDIIRENLDAVTEYWVDFDWPTVWTTINGKGEVFKDDPLQLEADGWVWLSAGEELCDFLDNVIGMAQDFDVQSLKLVATHPLVSMEDVLELTTRNSDPQNTRLAEFRQWACEVIDSAMYGIPASFPSNLVYAASCFNLLPRVSYLLENGGDPDSTNNCNEDAIGAAARNEHADMVRLLGRDADVVDSLFAGAYLGLIDVVEMQLDADTVDGLALDVNTMFGCGCQAFLPNAKRRY
jgi:hypothetical protein